MSLQGELSQYSLSPKLALFESGDRSSSSTILFVGGLSDGLSSVPYLPALSERLEGLRWSLAQIELSSARTQYGLSSLERDSVEMGLAIKFLESKGKKTIVLMGHSTGCQDVMQFLTQTPQNAPLHLVRGAILQAPVSDLEYFAYSASLEARAWAVIARKMVQDGKGKDWLPAAASESLLSQGGGDHSVFESIVPFTAYRFDSLYNPGGDDDFFTSTLPPSSLRFHLINKPLLILLGGSDEYYPPTLGNTTALEALLTKWKGTSNLIAHTSAIIPGGNHTIDDSTARVKFFEVVESFLNA